MRMIFNCALAQILKIRLVSIPVLLALLVSGAYAQPSASLTGRITDPSDALVAGARVTLTDPRGFDQTTTTDDLGVYRFRGLAEGEHIFRVAIAGFSAVTRTLAVKAGVENRLDMPLKLDILAEHAVVASTRLAESPEMIPGTVSILDARTIESSRVFTTSEALRKVPGLNVRDEEGFGLRPNIGIRGVNPTRSTKVLLLEDGIPLSYAPYGDNASYYHPPIERFSSVEVLKGAGQVLYGPATVSGVVNYITPTPPPSPAGSLTLVGGTRDYVNSRFNWGGTWGGTGLLLDAMRKQGEGSRENLRFGLSDFNVKIMRAVGGAQMWTLKGNYYGERSDLTYSGLSEEEYRQNPRQNPFRNDAFYGDRFGASAIHSIALNSRATITTNAYASRFLRDWWRQSSNSNERPNDRSNPACGGMSNLNTTCGNQGRLRAYTTWGVEPRFRVSGEFVGVRNDAEFGLRMHFEHQNRRQENGTLPTSRSGFAVENNIRKNRAYSAFLQNRFQIGALVVTPGVRVERIAYERSNRLALGGHGVTGRTSITELVPGVGLSYGFTGNLFVFGGIHRGFAPPRTEDIISNATGASLDLAPERSWNYEAGVRAQVARSASLEATAFGMDYENQVVPSSVAGGVGALLTNGGATLHQGIEFAGRLDMGTIFGLRHNLYARTAITYIPISRFAGERFSAIPSFGKVRVTGNRLPYAPRTFMNTTIGYTHPLGFESLIEGVFTGRQWSDDLNTSAPTPDGQRGMIPSQATLNATINIPMEALRSTLFVSVKNVLDRTFIVDRSRGILPSTPRLVQAGLKLHF